jgi:hypothetical protein
MSVVDMTVPQDHIRTEGRSLTPDDLEGRDAEKNGFNGTDEKYIGGRIHEMGLTLEYSASQGLDETIETRERSSLLFAKYKIFLHAFIWMVMTG